MISSQRFATILLPLTNSRAIHRFLHFDLHHSQQDGAVVAFGQGADDGTGHLLDLPTITVLRPPILLKRLQRRRKGERRRTGISMFYICTAFPSLKTLCCYS